MFTDKIHRYPGNAWAAAGMMRVLATLNNTESGGRFSEQQADLEEWIEEILVASWDKQVGNQMNGSNDISTDVCYRHRTAP